MHKNKSTNKIIKYVYCLVFSFFFVLAYNNYFFEHIFLGNQSIFNIFIFFAMSYIIHLSYSIKEKAIHRNCFVFSFILSLILVIGQPIYQYGHLGSLFVSSYKLLITMVSILGFAVGFESILALLLYYLTEKIELKSSTQWKIYKFPAIWGVVFFLSWIPCYLAYYPGIFSYDISGQTLEALGLQTMTKHHPPLHTLLWKLCLTIEQNLDINALVIYSLFQMTLLAVSLTYLLNFFIKKKMNNWLILACALFFCLNPTIALFSFIPTKDVLFAICLVFFTTELCKFVSEKDRYTKNIFCNIRFIVAGVLCCLLRNNMIYALIPASLIIIIMFRRYRKNFLIWVSCIIFLYGFVNGPIYASLGIEEGNVREMLSVPMQQISYVVINYKDELSAQDINDINQYLPVDELEILYNPRFADPVKITFNSEYFEEDSSTFFKVWGRLLLQYPDEYITSFLNLNLPYWYPDTNSCAHLYNDELSRRSYIETYIYPVETTGYEVVRDSKIPFLYDFYEKVASYLLFDTIPIVSNIFSISTPIWVMLATILVLKTKRKLHLTTIFLPTILYWCTFLLGPVCNFRYVFPITLLYPLFLVLMLQSDKLEHPAE